MNNIRNGELFSKLNQRFPYAESALIAADDQNEILSEASQNILVETFDTDEAFASDAQNSIKNVLENLIFSGKEFLDKQSSAMWESVYWEKDNYRPDKVVNTVNELYKKSAKDTQDKLREFFSNSGRNSVDIKSLLEDNQTSTSHGSGSNSNATDSSGSSQVGVNSSGSYMGISAALDVKTNNQHRDAQETSNTFANKSESTHQKHNETADTRFNDSSVSGEVDKDELLKLLEESRQNIQWSGERFIIKPLKLSRINLAKIRSDQEFTNRATSVRYSTAILSTEVHIDAAYETPVREELKQLERKKELLSKLLSSSKSLLEHLANQIADIRQEQSLQSTLQDLVNHTADIQRKQSRQSIEQQKQANEITAIRQQKIQQVADIRQKQIQLEEKLNGTLKQLEEVNEKVTKFNSDLQTIPKAVLAPVEERLTRLECKIEVASTIAGMSETEKGEQLIKAAEAGNITLIRLLIRAGADVNARGGNLGTPLHGAAWQGHVGAIKVLVEHNADVNARNDYLNTPLHEAAWNGHVDAIKVLLKHNAEANAKNTLGSTALQQAAWRGHLDAVKILSSRVNVNSQNDNGSTALHDAAYHGHTEIVKVLLAAGTNRSLKNKESKTPKDYACERKHSRTCAVF